MGLARTSPECRRQILKSRVVAAWTKEPRRGHSSGIQRIGRSIEALQRSARLQQNESREHGDVAQDAIPCDKSHAKEALSRLPRRDRVSACRDAEANKYRTGVLWMTMIPEHARGGRKRHATS